MYIQSCGHCLPTSTFKGVRFELGAVTVDPQTPSYNPRPLISYLAALRVPYFYEEQGQLRKALAGERTLPTLLIWNFLTYMYLYTVLPMVQVYSRRLSPSQNVLPSVVSAHGWNEAGSTRALGGRGTTCWQWGNTLTTWRRAFSCLPFTMALLGWWRPTTQSSEWVNEREPSSAVVIKPDQELSSFIVWKKITVFSLGWWPLLCMLYIDILCSADLIYNVRIRDGIRVVSVCSREL